MVLLAQINPMATPSGSSYPAPHNLPSPSPSDLADLESYHAHQICGIVAHLKDRGVASIALRCLHHAAECLTVRREQEEVLSIFTRIHKETGWRINFIPEDLMNKWRWSPGEVSTTLNGINAPPPASTVGATQLQAANAMAAVASAAGGMSNGANSIMSSFSNAGLSGGGLGMGAAQPSPQYQFDQYAEVQNLKRTQQHQREASLASQASQRSQMSQGSGNASMHNAGQQQTSPPQVPPQGIVNPMYQQKLPPTWQPYYVSPDQTADVGQPRNVGGGGLGLSLEQGFPAPYAQRY